MGLGAEPSDYGAEDGDDEFSEQANWSGESLEPESSENDEGVAELEWEFEFVPKKREKGRGKDPHYKWPSERDYKPTKSHRHHYENSSEEENHEDNHNHESRHHHKKHHSHKKSQHESKSKHHKSDKHHKKHHEKESHKKHHHHHDNQIDLEFLQDE
jgi:hypothetical protein